MVNELAPARSELLCYPASKWNVDLHQKFWCSCTRKLRVCQPPASGLPLFLQFHDWVMEGQRVLGLGLWRPSGVDPVNLFRGHWTRPYKVFVILSCVKQFHMQKSLHILSLQFIVLGQLSLTYHLSQHVAAGVLVADTTQADFPATTSSYIVFM